MAARRDEEASGRLGSSDSMSTKSAVVLNNVMELDALEDLRSVETPGSLRLDSEVASGTLPARTGKVLPRETPLETLSRLEAIDV